MKPVYQTKFGEKEGNCFAACIASILEIGIEGIPDFYNEYQSMWHVEFEKWLLLRGYYPLLITNPIGIYNWPPRDCYYIAGGKSPRGDFGHATVAYNGECVHDPFPEGDCDLVGGKYEDWKSFTIFLATKK